MIVVYRCTASEDVAELDSVAASVNGVVLPEDAEYYPAIQVDNGSLPSTVNFTNSGPVAAVELVGGLSPRKPK